MWVGLLDDEVELGQVDPVVAAGAQDIASNLGDAQLRGAQQRLGVPETVAEADTAVGVGVRYQSHEDVRRPAVEAAAFQHLGADAVVGDGEVAAP
jgi:hypothetical protein